MPRQGQRVLVLASVLGLVILIGTRSADAHPSDSETLTIDLLLSTDGLLTIDAAMNPGPSYDLHQSESDRADVAAAVIESLGIDPANASINAALSDRYHEVGFVVRLREPYTNGSRGELQVESTRLQQIAAARNIKRLKLALCDTFTSDAARVSSPFVIAASATAPGREPDPQRIERYGCRVWEFGQTDTPVSIAARLVPRSLATTGGGLPSVAIGALLICFGFALCVTSRRARGSITSGPIRPYT